MLPNSERHSKTCPPTYEDFATSIEGLGYLEKRHHGTAQQVCIRMLEFARLERVTVSTRLSSFDPLLIAMLIS